MTDKSKLFWNVLNILARITFYVMWIYLAWKETGFATAFCLVGSICAVELLSFAIGFQRQRLDIFFVEFAAILPVISKVVDEINELKKVRMDAHMTISSGGLGPIDPIDPLAKKQEGM